MAFNLSSLGAAIKRSLRLFGRASPGSRARTGVPRGPAPGARPYPGDFAGNAVVRYSPKPDGNPDPGEIVWSWVPFEEDHGRGKDRPVLLVGHDGPWLLGLMLTSKDHDNGRRAADYVDVGTGAWDQQRRPSEAKVDRIVRIDPAAIRREGAVLDSRAYQAVAAALRSRHHWR